MEKRTSRRNKLILLYIAAAVVCIVAAVSLLKFRSDINNTERAASYRLDRYEETRESSELLKQLLKENNGICISNATGKSHLFLRMIKDEEIASLYSVKLDDLTEYGYKIIRWGNSIDIFARDNKGLERAAFYLSHALIDDNGMLLIKQDERIVDSGKNVYSEAYVVSEALSNYTIISNSKAKEAISRLTYYINQSCGIVLDEKTKSLDCTIEFEIVNMDEPYAIDITESGIRFKAQNEEYLKKAVDVFANTYLGWEFAGTDREKVNLRKTVLNIDKSKGYNSEWISEREPIVTLWNVNSSRGVFLNNSTSLMVDVMSYSEDQLYDYVRMMKFCGFTGIQVTDMCSAWAGAGGVEFVHERLRFMAEAAHSLDMKFTLWVWGSEFTGYGWVDNSVTYSSEGYQFAYENPDVLATFDKYYSYYAELADVCDRVIGHYYDPGNLYLPEDVGYFAKVLRDKFKAVNPDIEFCVDCWVDVFDKSTLLKELGSDVMFLENGYHSNEEDYTGFRSFCAANGTKLGTWSWNNGEMEIDQLAAMNYKPNFIKNTYQVSTKYDDILTPDYWSEMDSYHVLNVFSLYACGNLLIDPDQDVDNITYEISRAAVGEEYAEDFAKMLKLIEEARSGYNNDTFWWSEDGYILKSDSYNAAEIKKRSEEAMALLQNLIDENTEAYSLPLPMTLSDMCRLILPSIDEIHSFACFRLSFDELKNEANGLNKEELEARLNELSLPVSEFNTVVGLWGQIEARAQYELLIELAKEYEVNFEYDPTFKMERKYRIYSYFITYQKGHSEPVVLKYPYFQYGVAYGSEETAKLVSELIDEGILVSDEDGGVYLSDWEHYKYSFN